MKVAVKRFACTGCGKCCNRSPEVELSEAGALADTFVFRLMFRVYWLPKRIQDFLALGERGANGSAVFYGRKRLLSALAARSWPVKAQRDGNRVDYTKYLSISALALDTSPGVCGALTGTQCGIYDRRPVSCRSVPLHYSRPEATAEADLDAFVAKPGYRCDTSDSASVVLRNGHIVDDEMNAARSKAISVASADRPWAEAIIRRLKASSDYPGLPTLEEIEANARFAATTTSMRIAWQIAAEVGLIGSEERDRLVEIQLEAIGQALELSECPQESRETLQEMQAEYRRHLYEPQTLSAIG